jgi:hypothetical protein
MTAALLIVLLGQQPDSSSESLGIRFEAWRPTVRGSLHIDKAFGQDFLGDDDLDPGSFSFDEDGGLDRASRAGRVEIQLLPEAEFGQVVSIGWARWTGERTLEEGENLGTGVILPAGTALKSTLRYWEVQAGFRRSWGSEPWEYGYQVTLSAFALMLRGEAPGGEFKALNASFGPAVMGHAASVIAGPLKGEGWAQIQYLPLGDNIKVEGGLSLKLFWSWGNLDVGYSGLFAIVDGDAISLTSPTLALAVRF